MFCQVGLLSIQGQVSYRIGHYDKMPLTGEAPIVNHNDKEPAAQKAGMDVALLKDLIERSQEGDTQALEALYKKYKRPLFNLAYRHTYNTEVAEDLLQDIFVKIFTNLQGLQNAETFNGWVYRIALNTCYSYLRSMRSKHKKTVSLSEVERVIQTDHNGVQERVMKRPLDEAIQSLPKGLRSVFLLHDVQGFKHEEIAKMLGCSAGTSKSQLFKARMKIRAYLKDKGIL